MKAIVQTRYGEPEDVLELREIDTPEIGDDEVLVQVRATSVHADVWHAVGGRPIIDRTFPLSEAGAAMRYLQDGGGPGKILITPQ